MYKLWVIVPTYNERANLLELTGGLFKLDLPLTVLVVDDASPDGTGQLADELVQKYSSRMYVLHRSGKLGLGSAYREGFAYALAGGATVVGEMDADLSHLPEDLSRLWQALASGADVVVGSRRVPGGSIVGWSRWRHLMSWGAATISRLILGIKTRDVTSGFRLYRAEALARVSWQEVRSDGYAWQEEILYLLERSGAHVTEVPVIFKDRTKGKSKLKGKDIVEFFRTIVRLSGQRF
ncbi:MAG: polyprenol monophosphomannose synthase [Candidatus Veblenbacteria bacterium]|nr:polyprenol monophosphomannose synthase [Candidatus Veblenbacteria bacterium]